MSKLLDSITDTASKAYSSAQASISGLSADPSGFSDLAPFPPSSGNQTRQAQIPNYRLANSTRNIRDR